MPTAVLLCSSRASEMICIVTHQSQAGHAMGPRKPDRTIGTCFMTSGLSRYCNYMLLDSPFLHNSFTCTGRPIPLGACIYI